MICKYTLLVVLYYIRNIFAHSDTTEQSKKVSWQLFEMYILMALEIIFEPVNVVNTVSTVT